MYRVPASNMMLNPLVQKHIDKLSTTSAHAVTLNLEDAIAPERKPEALRNIADILQERPSIDAQIIVRVNPLDQGGDKEIEFLNDFDFDAVRLSKPRRNLC